MTLYRITPNIQSALEALESATGVAGKVIKERIVNGEKKGLRQ